MRALLVAESSQRSSRREQFVAGPASQARRETYSRGTCSERAFHLKSMYKCRFVFSEACLQVCSTLDGAVPLTKFVCPWLTRGKRRPGTSQQNHTHMYLAGLLYTLLCCALKKHAAANRQAVAALRCTAAGHPSGPAFAHQCKELQETRLEKYNST